MKKMRTRALFTLLIMIMVGSVFSYGHGSQTKNSEPQVSPTEPVRIGVCMPSSGYLAEVAKFQSEGIKMALDMQKDKVGRQIELIFRYFGASSQDYSQSLQKLLLEDKVTGVISCASADMISRAAGVLKQRSVPFIATTSAGLDWKTKEGSSIVRLSPSLEDQANACSRFMTDILHARRVGLLVAVDNESCVRLASLFSSDMVNAGGKIVDIGYIKKGEDNANAIKHLMGERPDAVYVSYFGESTCAALAKIRSFDAVKPVVLSNILPEETFFNEVDKSMEGLYIQSDYIEEAVSSPQGKEFIEFYSKHAQKRSYLGSSIATGADAYFCMIDMISRQQRDKGHNSTGSSPALRSSLLGMTLTGTTTANEPIHLSFARVKKDFLGGATLKFVASVRVIRSDPVVHMRAQ